MAWSNVRSFDCGKTIFMLSVFYLDKHSLKQPPPRAHYFDFDKHEPTLFIYYPHFTFIIACRSIMLHAALKTTLIACNDNTLNYFQRNVKHFTHDNHARIWPMAIEIALLRAVFVFYWPSFEHLNFNPPECW